MSRTIEISRREIFQLDLDPTSGVLAGVSLRILDRRYEIEEPWVSLPTLNGEPLRCRFDTLIFGITPWSRPKTRFTNWEAYGRTDRIEQDCYFKLVSYMSSSQEMFEIELVWFEWMSPDLAWHNIDWTI